MPRYTFIFLNAKTGIIFTAVGPELSIQSLGFSQEMKKIILYTNKITCLISYFL